MIKNKMTKGERYMLSAEFSILVKITTERDASRHK